MNIVSVHSHVMRGFLAAVVASAFLGCASTPHRPFVQATAPKIGCDTAPMNVSPEQTTPEISSEPPFTLHFLEFDDQGWAYPNTTDSTSNQKSSAGYQIDCAIADLAHKVENGDVLSYVYIHGWHHSAKSGDRDVIRFREMLREKSRSEKKRQVVGFYIGWNGNTLDFPVLREATFWGRKNAAHHVSEGSAREFFARVKALRNHYNRPRFPRSKNCGELHALNKGKDCPLRTVMIGHSFGAWVLYSATSPYILETLAGISDLPPDDANPPVTARERGIADLVILLNPAFEASRYDAVHQAARRYKPKTFETPLLVSVTSTADLATKNAFPVARFFNSIFQYPATSDAESQAMKRTHGHLSAYITHELTVDMSRASKRESEFSCVIDAAGNYSDRQALRDRFFSAAKVADGKMRLWPRWEREMCGGLSLKNVGNADHDPYSIVWNIRTFKDVIPDHNAITEFPLRDFVEQLYDDLGRMPKLGLVR